MNGCPFRVHAITFAAASFPRKPTKPHPVKIFRRRDLPGNVTLPPDNATFR